jgi:hypothetical protein
LATYFRQDSKTKARANKFYSGIYQDMEKLGKEVVGAISMTVFYVLTPVPNNSIRAYSNWSSVVVMLATAQVMVDG